LVRHFPGLAFSVAPIAFHYSITTVVCHFAFLIDHAVKLKAVYGELTTRFNAVSAAAWMFQHGALTIKELQSIQSLRDRPTEASETLLNVIIEQPSAVYESFLDALKHSNQQHVYQWIVYDMNSSGQNNFFYNVCRSLHSV